MVNGTWPPSLKIFFLFEFVFFLACPAYITPDLQNDHPQQVEAGHKVGVVRQTEKAATKKFQKSAGPFTRGLTELYTAATMVPYRPTDRNTEEKEKEKKKRKTKRNPNFVFKSKRLRLYSHTQCSTKIISFLFFFLIIHLIDIHLIDPGGRGRPPGPRPKWQRRDRIGGPGALCHDLRTTRSAAGPPSCCLLLPASSLQSLLYL